MKKELLLFVVLLWGVLFAPLAAEEEGARGFRLLQEGLYQEALEDFNYAWSKYPEQKNYETYIDVCKKMIRAQNLFEEGKYADSLLLTEEVALVMPRDEKVKALLAQRKKSGQVKGKHKR